MTKEVIKIVHLNLVVFCRVIHCQHDTPYNYRLLVIRITSHLDYRPVSHDMAKKV